MFCHDMWVGPDAGHAQYEAETYELQQKVNGVWQRMTFTTGSGEDVGQSRPQKPPAGKYYKVSTE